MSSRVNVITNSLGSGDWIVVELNGEAVFSGHSVSAYDLACILDEVQGFEFGRFEEVTDAEMEERY